MLCGFAIDGSVDEVPVPVACEIVGLDSGGDDETEAVVRGLVVDVEGEVEAFGERVEAHVDIDGKGGGVGACASRCVEPRGYGESARVADGCAEGAVGEHVGRGVGPPFDADVVGEGGKVVGIACVAVVLESELEVVLPAAGAIFEAHGSIAGDVNVESGVGEAYAVRLGLDAHGIAWGDPRVGFASVCFVNLDGRQAEPLGGNDEASLP
mgnify:CR=1 FL=1